MARRPPARSRTRSLVRTSQHSRSQQQALIRAYELALPVLRQPLAEDLSAKEPPPVPKGRFVPQAVLIGG